MADLGIEDDDDILELPGGDEKVTVPKEKGEAEKDGDGDTGKPGRARGDDRDEDDAEPDQLTRARRHNRRLERRLSGIVRENMELREQVRTHSDVLARLSRAHLESDLRSAQGSVSAAEQRLIQARDDENRQEEVAAERDLAQARSRAAELERAVRGTEDERGPARDPKATPRTGREPDPRLERATELADDWAERHPWYNAKGNVEDSEIVRAVSAAIANDPRNPIDIDDEEHFEELDRRLARRLPERYRVERKPAKDDKDVDDEPDVAGTRGGTRRANPSQPASDADAMPETLTRRQIAVYERMGYSWNNPEHRKQIIETERSNVEQRKERRRG